MAVNMSGKRSALIRVSRCLPTYITMHTWGRAMDDYWAGQLLVGSGVSKDGQLGQANCALKFSLFSHTQHYSTLSHALLWITPLTLSTYCIRGVCGGWFPPQVMEKRVRVKKTPLTVTASGVAGADSKALLDLIEAEGQMFSNDKLQEDTNEAKNALEAYIYGLRSKLYENLAPYVQEVRNSLTAPGAKPYLRWGGRLGFRFRGSVC